MFTTSGTRPPSASAVPIAVVIPAISLERLPSFSYVFAVRSQEYTSVPATVYTTFASGETRLLRFIAYVIGAVVVITGSAESSRASLIFQSEGMSWKFSS